MLQNSTFVGLALPLFLIAFFGYLVWLQFFSLLKPVNYSFKLVVCQVAIDEEGTTTQIVTGASNVKEGQKVPVVLDGGRVAGGHDGKKVAGGVKIKKGKLRGVESNGMMTVFVFDQSE